MALATFSLGIATTHGHTSKYFATSAGTKAINRTTAGRGRQMIRPSRPCLMAVRRVFQEMVHTLRDVMLPAYPAILAVL
jgi:hypothetical protein